MDLRLTDLGLDLDARYGFLRRLREVFARECWADASLKRQLGERLSKEGKALQTLLDQAHDMQDPPLPGLAILPRRSQRLASIAARLRGSAAVWAS